MLLPQELGQRRRKAVIVDGDAVSTHFKFNGVNVLAAKLRKKLRRQLRETALPHPMAHLRPLHIRVFLTQYLLTIAVEYVQNALFLVPGKLQSVILFCCRERVLSFPLTKYSV